MRLIIGSNSLISVSLQRNWEKKEIKFHATTRRIEAKNKNIFYLDLLDLDDIKLSKNYSEVIICVSCTDLTLCESNPEETYKINVDAIIKLIKFFADTSTQIIIFSSNQVFDGEKPFRKIDDRRNPISEYGKQKKSLEEYAEDFKNVTILRLTRVFSYEFNLFKNWKKRLLEGQEIEAFSDYCISPLHIDKVIAKINNLIKKRKFGISHCHGGYSDITYYDFAVSIANDLQCPLELVKKTSFKDANFNYRLPKYTSLLEE